MLEARDLQLGQGFLAVMLHLATIESHLVRFVAEIIAVDLHDGAGPTRRVLHPRPRTEAL